MPALAVSLLMFAAPISAKQCAEAMVDRVLGRVFEGAEEDDVLQRSVESMKDPLVKTQALVQAEVVKRCARPPAFMAEWYAWEEDGDSPLEPKVEAWSGELAAAVVKQLTAPERELRALSSDALCERAMGRVTPALWMVAEPVGDREHRTWAAWKPADVAAYYAAACKAEKVATKFREGLLCYARIRSKGFALLGDIGDCDIEAAGDLDEFVNGVSAKLDAEIAAGVKPKRR